MILAFALLLAERIPNAFLLGRFWAEEGIVYFGNAWSRPWPEALFAVHSGYINLTASLATLLAADWVPLPLAPLFTAAIALLIQLCPAILLATSGVAWLRPRWVLAAGLLLLAAPPMAAEVWLTTITSQFHLTLCAALILTLPVRGGVAGILQGVLLVFAGLSGPTGGFLIPLFALRSLIDRSPARAAQTLLLCVATSAQAYAVLTHPEPGRPLGIGLQLLALIAVQKHVILPMLGPAATRLFAARVRAEALHGPVSWLGVAACLLAVAAGVSASIRARCRETAWLFAAAFVIMVPSYFGALGEHTMLLDAGFGGRYAYGPTVLFGLALLSLAATAKGWPRLLCGGLVGWMIALGGLGYFHTAAFFTDGPAWSGEVARWRADPAYVARLWPTGGDWRIWLGPDNARR